jgi:hypothetical protein
MADEFGHLTQGTVLAQAEYESLAGHVFQSQATGDLLYASSATQLSRLGIGAANTHSQVVGGIPAWVASPILADNAALKIGVTAQAELYNDGVDTFLDLQKVGSGALMIALAGSFPSPDGTAVHIWKGNAGSQVASSNSVLILEHASATDLQFLAPSGSYKRILFGEPGAPVHGWLQYYGSTATPASTLSIGTGEGERIRISANAFQFQEATVLDSSTGALTITSAAAATWGTTVGDLTLAAAGSLVVTLAVDDTDALKMANDVSTYYQVSTRNLASTGGGAVHSFKTEAPTIASAANARYSLLEFGGYSLNYTGTTTVTFLVAQILSTPMTLTSTGTLQIDQATQYTMRAPAASTNITAVELSAIRILDGGGGAGSTTNQHGIIMETLAGGDTANYYLTLGSTDVDHSLLHVGVSGDPVMSWDESEDSFAFNKDLIPLTDGGADLGTQTNFQWANVWADLVNGAEITMANKWRMLESELYPRYPVGWAVGYDSRWEDGVSLWKNPDLVAEDARPVFAVTDEWIEFKGRRITPEMLDLVIALAEEA